MGDDMALSKFGDGCDRIPSEFRFRTRLRLARHRRHKNFHRLIIAFDARLRRERISGIMVHAAIVFSPMDFRSISANQIVVWTALLLGLLLALVVGNAVGSSDMRLPAALVAVIPVAVIFAKLKTNVWVLLPIGWYLTGRLPWLPLPFSAS